MAGQDIKKLLPAGGAQPVNVSGDYIYLKFADRPIDVIIDGGNSGQTRVTMEAGDKYRPGAFEAFEIVNPDTERQAQVIFTVGEGDYNRQIVRGEISIEPVLRNADGTTKPDTRGEIRVNLQPVKLTTEAYSVGDLIDAFERPEFPDSGFSGRKLFHGPDGTVGLSVANSADETGIMLFDPKTNALISTEQWDTSPSGFVQDVCYLPGFGYLYLDNGENLRDMQDNILLDLEEAGYSGMESMDYEPATDTLLIKQVNSTLLVRVSRDFEIVGELLVESIGSTLLDEVRVDRWTGNIMLHRNFDLEEFSADGQYLGNIYFGGGMNFEDGYIPFRNQITTRDGLQIEIHAMRDFTTMPEFRAVRPGCDLMNALTRPDRLPQVSAQIAVEDLGDGIRVSGEVIKAALEYYFKRAAPDDYLDHVYQFDMDRTGNGMPFKTVNSGNRTFAAAAIKDSFDTILPGQLVLVVDNELEMGEPI
ncbi:hypothetical protein [Marinobacter sp. LN3S78]|uniref:hypothetical protein n=1 Tax=Marinobacter sp. LN3S78 TaxID=3382300 RepID=UPI00387A8BFC